MTKILRKFMFFLGQGSKSLHFACFFYQPEHTPQVSSASKNKNEQSSQPQNDDARICICAHDMIVLQWVQTREMRGTVLREMFPFPHTEPK